MNEINVYNLNTNKNEKFNLSLDEYLEIKRALEILESDLEMEMLYDQIMDAFWDYRNKVDYWRLRSLSGLSSQVLNYEVKSTLNRLAFNVLNLSKLFLDKHHYAKKDICHVFNQTKSLELKEKVILRKQKLSEENDRYFIGCKLRNRSQHGELPISQFWSGFKLRKNDDKRFITFKVKITKEELKKLEVPKSKMPNNEYIDLTDVIDGYIHGVSEMHFYNRDLTIEVVSNSRALLKSKIENLVAIENQKSCIVDLLVDGQFSEYIGLDRFTLSDHLRSKHLYAFDYSKFSFDLNGY